MIVFITLNRGLELLFELVQDLSKCIRNVHNLVVISNNFGQFAVFVAELTNNRGVSSVAIENACSRDCNFNFRWLHIF